jgi:hypothetical protein
MSIDNRHNVAPQRARIFSDIAVRTWNPVTKFLHRSIKRMPQHHYILGCGAISDGGFLPVDIV